MDGVTVRLANFSGGAGCESEKRQPLELPDDVQCTMSVRARLCVSLFVCLRVHRLRVWFARAFAHASADGIHLLLRARLADITGTL